MKIKRLVVLVPGFTGRSEYWQPICKRLQKEPGFGTDEAKWLPFDHGVGRLSAGHLAAISLRLQALIDAEWTRAEGYEDIVLVGHSMGGVIVRQVYLLSVGAVMGEQKSFWGEYVTRIVLLASVNRGVDVRRRLGYQVAFWLYRLVPLLPRLYILDTIRGSNFLTNLRINWIRYFGSIAATGTRSTSIRTPPQVVQLLGDQDNLVHSEDSKDVLAFPNGFYIKVPNADHQQMYRLEAAPDPELRYAVLRQGFLGDISAAENPMPLKQEVRRVIFLLHGIRASNVDQWITELKSLIARYDPMHTAVIHPTYGYFSAARFALPSVRKRNIAVFQDWYTEALAQYPSADFNIIAHSNGTYILGQSLRATPGMRFKNVVLAGSVLPPSFWQQFQGLNDQVSRIRNDRANRDWPVALLCSALRGLYMQDVGPGGFCGFLGHETLEVAYYNGGHGAALNPSNQKNLVDFVFDRDLETTTELSSSPGYFRQVSNLMPYLAKLFALGGISGCALFIWQGGNFHADRALICVLSILVTYVVLDIL